MTCHARMKYLPKAVELRAPQAGHKNRLAKPVTIELCALSSGPLPSPSHRIVFLSFKHFSVLWEQALLESPLARRASERGIDVRPEWATAAKVFVDGLGPEVVDSQKKMGCGHGTSLFKKTMKSISGKPLRACPPSAPSSNLVVEGGLWFLMSRPCLNC